jgi:hypothetical protein
MRGCDRIDDCMGGSGAPATTSPRRIFLGRGLEVDCRERDAAEGEDRILASYETGGVRAAYVEPVAVGDRLPDMPLFLANDYYVPVPLEPTYRATWDASPEEMRVAVETGVMPDPDAE